MKIVLNKYNYIVCYATVGDLENSLEIKEELENPLDYQYINKELVYNPVPHVSKPLGVNLIYNGNEWIDEGKPQEKQKFWKEKMIETSNQIKELQEIGLGGGAEEIALKAKLEQYKEQYMNAVQEEAIEIDNKISIPETLEERQDLSQEVVIDVEENNPPITLEERLRMRPR